LRLPHGPASFDWSEVSFSEDADASGSTGCSALIGADAPGSTRCSAPIGTAAASRHQEAQSNDAKNFHTHGMPY
jgi:hypothetical protein